MKYRLHFALPVAVSIALLATGSAAADPPAEDDFAAAADLSADPLPIAFTADNVDATGEAGEPDHAGASLGGGCTGPLDPDELCLSSVWASWTAPQTGRVTLDLCGSDFNTTLGVYTGNAVDALATVASNDDFVGSCSGNDGISSATFTAAAGTTYRIALAGHQNDEGLIGGGLYYGPDTRIESGPLSSTSSSTAYLYFQSSIAGSSFECSLDKSAFAGCSSPAQYSNLSLGTHEFAVRAIENGTGNVDPLPASRNWTVTPRPSRSPIRVPAGIRPRPTPPNSAFSVNGSPRLDRHGAVTFKLTFADDGVLMANLTARAPKKKSHQRRRSATIPIGSARKVISGPGTVPVRIKLSSVARTILRKRGKLRLKATWKFTPTGGLAATKVTRVTLKLPRKQRQSRKP